MSRKYRHLVARLLLAAFVIAQAAVSAYACPGANDAANTTIAAESMSADCDMMPRLDPNAPTLCFAHCQPGQQNIDQSSSPSAQPALLDGLVVLLPDVVASESSFRAYRAQQFTATAPPHAILHCCFRI